MIITLLSMVAIYFHQSQRSKKNKQRIRTKLTHKKKKAIKQKDQATKPKENEANQIKNKKKAENT